MPVEVTVTITGSSVEDVHSQIDKLKTGPEAPTAAGSSTTAPPAPAAAASSSPEPTPEHASTPAAESQQPPWAPSS